jgi:putative salt-induced outer membrane protein YdiY
MNTRAKILSAVLLLAAPLAARLKTDVVVMSNGDRITGEIKGLDAGVLKVDLDYVDGAISIEWLKVARVESSQLFIVQVQDGSMYTGTLATAPGDIRKIMLWQPDQPDQGATIIEHPRVVRMEETAESFFQRWSGQLNLGYVYSKGNNSSQNTFGSTVEYRRERWGATGTFNSSLSSSSGAATSTRNQLDLTAYHLLPWKNYFYGGLGSFLQSSVQRISRQTTLGGGIGRYFKNTNRARIAVLGGFAWQTTRYEQSSPPIPNQQAAAGLIATDIRVFIFKKTNLSLSAYIIPSLTDSHRVRFNTNASYYWKIYGNLSWNLSFYGNWDTKPPANFASSDYGTSVGLKWTFGYW